MEYNCYDCGMPYYREDWNSRYGNLCYPCIRIRRAEEREQERINEQIRLAEIARRRNQEAAFGYRWGYNFQEDLGVRGNNFEFILNEDGGLSFKVKRLNFFIDRVPNSQFQAGMKTKLYELGWGQGSWRERWEEIRAGAFNAGANPQWHEAFAINWHQCGLVWSLNRYPKVRFLNCAHQKTFGFNKGKVININGLDVFREVIFSDPDLQKAFDDGLTKYVSENKFQIYESIAENTINTKVYLSEGQRKFLIFYLFVASLVMLKKFHDGFGWFGFPVYAAATIFIWKNKEYAWTSIWKGPFRYTFGLHLLVSAALLYLNDAYSGIIKFFAKLF